MLLQKVLTFATWLWAPFQVSQGPPVQSDVVTTVDCLSRSTTHTLEDLVTCFETYTVPRDTYHSDADFNANQPDATSWFNVVQSLLYVDGNCTLVPIPSAFSSIYQVSLFTESVAGGHSFCVLSETQTTGTRFLRGWGSMVVPATRAAVSRYIHISAPHPIYDSGTPAEAAAIFKRTGAKTLFVPGRHREAYLINSCVGPDYNRTDPAHDSVSWSPDS